MAKTLLVLAVGLLALGLVAAECPNACSGHGVCQSYRDFCQCYKGYQGNDCSQRTCPFGLSFIDTPQGDLDHDNALDSGFGDRTATGANRPQGTSDSTALNPMWRPDGWWENHPSQLYGTVDDAATLPMHTKLQEGHFYAECSNRGLCDRETGECQCFTGYEGTGCNRTVCANGCSGHGTCESVREQLPTDSDYLLWDADKSMGCVCDPEYFGNDCSKRRCYRNDDPLTSVTTVRGVSEMLAEQGETQTLRVACARNGDVLAASRFTLTYTDVQFGESYTTAQFAPSISDADLLALLRALPNQVLGSSQGVTDSQDYNKLVSVTADHTENINGGNIYRWNFVFHKSLGNVPTMTVDTTNQVCSAGWELPASYKTATWNEHIGVELVGAGPTSNAEVTFTADDNDDATDTYTYKLEWAGTAHTVQSNAQEFTAAAAYIEHSGSTGTDSPIGELFPVKFTFPLGADAAAFNRGTGTTNTYKINFYAPAVETSLFTPKFEISSTLPIAYVLDARGGTAEKLYIEYVSPWSVISTASEIYTIAISATAPEYDWSSAVGADDVDGTSVPAGWNQLESCVAASDACKIKVWFEHGAAARASSGATWTLSGTAGAISSSGTAEEVATLTWASASYPSEAANIVVTYVADNVDTDGDFYSWSYNGVNMGEYSFPAAAAALGGTTNMELSTLRIAFADGVYRAARATTGQEWAFNLVQLPYQTTWSYQETLRVHYSDADAVTGSRVTITNNLGIVINLVTTDAATDTYRWKVTTGENYVDEAWITGGNMVDGPGLLHNAATHSLYATDLSNMLFEFTGGADDANRACDGSTNAYYYVQLGAEGINDFPSCSDRGICDEEAGECKCFKGYAGQDCHEQHALSL